MGNSSSAPDPRCFVSSECCNGNSLGVIDPIYALSHSYCRATLSTSTAKTTTSHTSHASLISITRSSPTPSTGMIKCWIMDTDRVTPKKSDDYIPGTDRCVTYASFDPRTKTYVNTFSAVSRDTFDTMNSYPRVYGNVRACTTDFCNVPEMKVIPSSIYNGLEATPIVSLSGLKCYVGISDHAKRNEQPIVGATKCVRYRFKPDYNSTSVYQYAGVDEQVSKSISQFDHLYQDFFSCGYDYCNVPIDVPDSVPTAQLPIVTASNATNLRCFQNSVDGSGAHPTVKSSGSNYCMRFIATETDNSTRSVIYGGMSSSDYQSFTKVSGSNQVYGCQTDYCNGPSPDNTTMHKCYVTDLTQGSMIRLNVPLPVDYCVSFMYSNSTIFSAVTAGQLEDMNRYPDIFQNIKSCTVDFCNLGFNSNATGSNPPRISPVTLDTSPSISSALPSPTDASPVAEIVNNLRCFTNFIDGIGAHPMVSSAHLDYCIRYALAFTETETVIYTAISRSDYSSILNAPPGTYKNIVGCQRDYCNGPIATNTQGVQCYISDLTDFSVVQWESRLPLDYCITVKYAGMTVYTAVTNSDLAFMESNGNTYRVLKKCTDDYCNLPGVAVSIIQPSLLPVICKLYDY